MSHRTNDPVSPIHKGEERKRGVAYTSKVQQSMAMWILVQNLARLCDLDTARKMNWLSGDFNELYLILLELLIAV